MTPARILIAAVLSGALLTACDSPEELTRKVDEARASVATATAELAHAKATAEADNLSSRGQKASVRQQPTEDARRAQTELDFKKIAREGGAGQDEQLREAGVMMNDPTQNALLELRAKQTQSVVTPDEAEVPAKGEANVLAAQAALDLAARHLSEAVANRDPR